MITTTREDSDGFRPNLDYPLVGLEASDTASPGEHPPLRHEPIYRP